MNKLLKEELSRIKSIMGVNESQEVQVSAEAMEKIKSDVDQVIANSEKERIRLTDQLERVEKAITNPEMADVKFALEELIKDTRRNLDMLYKESDRERLTKGYIENYERQMRIKQYDDERSERVKTAQLTKEQIIDVFVTALEGGSNYWYYLLDLPKDVLYMVNQEKVPLSEACGKHVLAGGSLNIYDAEEVEEMEDPENDYAGDKPEPLGTITMDSLLDTISIMRKDYPEKYENIVMDEYDADDADVFFQIATMGEVTFG